MDTLLSKSFSSGDGIRMGKEVFSLLWRYADELIIFAEYEEQLLRIELNVSVARDLMNLVMNIPKSKI